MARVYYHGIDGANGHIEEYKQVLKDICSKGLLSRRKRGVSDRLEVIRFNGLDYISVCERLELSKVEHTNLSTAYHDFIYQNTGIIINGNIEVIKPIIIDRYNSDVKRIMEQNPDKRYAFMIDDRHVKDEISIYDFVGLFYPYEMELFWYYLSQNETVLNRNDENIEFLRETLKQNNLDIPIIDSSRDEYLRDLTPVLTKKKTKDEIIRFYGNDNF